MWAELDFRYCNNLLPNLGPIEHPIERIRGVVQAIGKILKVHQLASLQVPAMSSMNWGIKLRWQTTSSSGSHNCS
jgi:hypothetical protein